MKDSLNLGNKKLKSIKTKNFPLEIINLNLSNNFLTSLDNDSLKSLKNLKELNVDVNKLTFIPNNLPPNLKTLTLNENLISKIENLPNNLNNLYLSHNLISKLENLPNSLNNLYLSHNLLSSLNFSNSNDILFNLKSLDLSFNKISFEFSNSNLSFRNSFPNLQTLNISNNLLKSLPELPSNLKYLNISNNSITSLNILPNSLDNLILDNNLITSISKLPENLKYLSVKSNKLTSLSELPKKLKSLTLDNNLIASISKLPENLTKFSASNNLLTSLPELPESLTQIILDNNLIKSLPNLPNNLIQLNISHNSLTSLPKLPQRLNKLYISDNSLTSLPKLPKSLTGLLLSRNKLTSLPDLPDNLEHLNVTSNLLTSIPDFSKLKKLDMDFKYNPISEQYYDVRSVNDKNIKINKNLNLEVLTLKKGTVLFHNIDKIEKVLEMYLGYNITNNFHLHPDHQVYFMLHPFYTGYYGNITTINVLLQDVNILLGLLPSENTKMGNDFYKFYDNKICKEIKTKILSSYGCASPEIIENNIMGWIAQDFMVGENFGYNENQHFKEYCHYISYYKDASGAIDRPEVMLYPFIKRQDKELITSSDEIYNVDDAKTWLEKNEDLYNFKTLYIIENNRNFEEYKTLIDSLLSKKGYTDSSGTYHMIRNEIDGMYMIQEFM